MEEEGDGDFPLAPNLTDGEMEASESVWECSGDVTGYTASSSNPAETFSTEAQFRHHQYGATRYGIKKGGSVSCKRHSIRWKKIKPKLNKNNKQSTY